MVMVYCDICGKPIDSRRNRITQKRYEELLEKHRNGFFSISYHQAVLDDKGKLVRMTYADNFTVCDECQEVANEAVFKAFEPIIKNRRKSVSTKTGKFPREPFQEPVPCCGEMPCDPF